MPAAIVIPVRQKLADKLQRESRLTQFDRQNNMMKILRGGGIPFSGGVVQTDATADGWTGVGFYYDSVRQSGPNGSGPTPFRQLTDHPSKGGDFLRR